MPIDALLLSLAVCFVFAVFAVVVAWTDYKTTTRHRRYEAVESKTNRAKKAA